MSPTRTLSRPRVRCRPHLCEAALTYSTPGLTEAQIRVKLAQEEEQDAADGNPSLHRVTPSSMLVEMLEIEELQCVLL